MQDILSSYTPITLEEMSGIRLMNRTDTKFVTTIDNLRRLLIMARDEYRVQEVKGMRNIPYYTLYFDTVDYDMYCDHVHGHTGRQKVRIRSYVNSGLNFLEVKTKDNHKRTRKERIVVDEFTPDSQTDEMEFMKQWHGSMKYYRFLSEKLKYSPRLLRKAIENRFNRITLVNNNKTERLTIDTSLQFANAATGKTCSLERIAIIELKRDGLVYSPILRMLNMLRIKPHHFSKYCIGLALTNDSLPLNRFKKRLQSIDKMIETDTWQQQQQQ